MDKYRVTMRSVTAGPDNSIADHSAIDYVREDFLDAYVADAKTKWQSVEVSDEVDHGPGGPEGATHVPAHLDHPLAGQTFPGKDSK